MKLGKLKILYMSEYKFDWNNFSGIKPDNDYRATNGGAIAITVLMKDGTHHEVCSFFHAFDYLKEHLNPEAIRLEGEESIHRQVKERIESSVIPRYFISAWNGNTPTELNPDDIDKWRYLPFIEEEMIKNDE
jgi:hypothetical protein